jgi:tetratricopeptide (TPR) repeat protein
MGYPGYGYPYYGYGLGFGYGYGLYGGYGYGGYLGYGYGGYGYGYPGYGYNGYSPYGPGYGAASGPVQYNGSSNGLTALAAAPAKVAQPDSSALKAAKEFGDKGEAAFRAGDYEGAVHALRHAALDDPKNAVVTMLLGQAFFATQRFEEAAGATQAAMRRLPKDRWGVVVTHYTELYGDTSDYTRQLRALEAALKEKPAKPELRFLAGFHFAYLGFTQQAIDQLDTALKFAPLDELARQLRDELRVKLANPPVPPEPPTPGLPSGPEIDES